MTSVALPALAISWRRLLPCAALVLAALLVFRDTAVAMVTIWIRSETFTHAFLVVPMSLWLVWRQRATLAALQPRAAPWVLLPMAATCALWLMGELAGVNAATQFALVTLLVLSVPLVFGLAVARAITFPLLFLFFCVPVGEFMVPRMMDWTADFTVAALQFSGVPVYREALQFVIPSGNWSVVEACSGVRYLIASFMVGTLFAYLNFHTSLRRAVFMVLSLAVPVVANWFRAYLIVMLGHLSGNELATGVDHVIYGWVFFGLVIGVMFAVGSRFAQAEPPAPPTLPTTDGGAAARRWASMAWAVGAAATALLLATQFYFLRIDRSQDLSAPTLALPANMGSIWTAQAEPLSSWVPAFSNSRSIATRSYADGAAAAAVWVGYYRGQGYDRKMVTSTNGITEPVAEAQWQQVDGGARVVRVADRTFNVRTSGLRGSPLGGSTQAQRLRVWQLYWIGGRLVTSDVQARLLLAWHRLMGRGDDSAVIFFYTPLATDPTPQDSAAADALLDRFTGQALAPVLEQLHQAHGLP